MSYYRIVPRDFFNEALLLKCLGHLLIQIERDPKLHYSLWTVSDYDGKPFKIEMDEDGYLSVSNHIFYFNGERMIFATRSNRLHHYPLEVIAIDDYTDVFDQQGNITDEFIELLDVMATKTK